MHIWYETEKEFFQMMEINYDEGILIIIQYKKYIYTRDLPGDCCW